MGIIGISGKKTVGKNTVAKIINQLTDNKYEEKCFADKLKDIICLLIGCTRDQLENESFKSKELGEEWWYWYMEVDGGYSPIILDYLTTTKKELKSYEGLELIKPTPRFLLQFIGTDLLRNQLHPQIWVNGLMNEYKPLSDIIKSNNTFDDTPEEASEAYENAFMEREDLYLKEEPNNLIYPSWCITDMRFPNEMEAVKKKGGITIRVERPGLIENNHPSETSLDSATFDFVINNDKDIEHLINEVRKILEKLSII